MRARATRGLLLLLLVLGFGVAAPHAQPVTHGVAITASVDALSAVPGRVERPRGTDPHVTPQAVLPATVRLPAPSTPTTRPSTPTPPSYDGSVAHQGRGPPGA